MNWYKQQSIMQKESWNWDKANAGFWAGIAIGLASWLGVTQLELENIKSQVGSDEAVVQTLKEEVKRQGGDPDQIIEQTVPQKTNLKEHSVLEEPQYATYDQLRNMRQNPEESIDKKEDQNQKHFDIYSDRLEQREGKWTHAYDDKTGSEYNGGPRKGVITVGVGHAMGANPDSSDRHAPRSRKVFQKLFGNAVNWDDVYNGKVELTEQQVNALTMEDIMEHVQRAQRLFPNYDTYPDYIQEALLDSVFRGDTGKKTAALINQGNWRAAADEYINRQDYINAERNNMRGIKIRMDKNRAAMLQYAKELGQ